MTLQSPTPSANQQRLGRRLALTSYYRITTDNAELLRFDSEPAANRGVGLRIGAGGVILLGIAAAILISGVFATVQNAAFSSIATSAIIGGIFGGLGIQRLVGGIAVATTRNSLTISAEQLTLEQSSRIGTPRSQQIDAAAVSSVQLRRRPILVGSIVRRRVDVVALELAVGDQIWILDGDRDAARLQPLAAALLQHLKLPAATQPT